MARDDAFLKLARDRWKLAQEADQRQREREKADLAMYAGEMWDKDALAARQAQPAQNGLPPLAARPTFNINLVKEPIRQVLNAERSSELGIEIVPADDFGDLGETPDDTEIELREGLVRRIQRESEAGDARTWAFARAVIAGRGYYGVMTRYLPGKTWDQEIFIQRFYNQSSVSLDPAHEQPDGSDADWAFVGNDLPWEEYKARWPRAQNGDRNRVVGSLSDDEWRALGDEAPGWFRTEGQTRMCRVVDYFYVERTPRTLVQLADGSSAWLDEIDENDVEIVDRRRVIDRAIQWCQLDGVQVLDETDWPGPDLPIVKVLGEELQPYDQERRAEGMVRSARDSQTGFNAMVSKWVELIGLAPIPPFMIAEGQVEGYEAWYQAANTRAVPYLPYRTKDLEGNVVGAPQRTNVDTPIQAIAASVQLFRDAIQSTTGIHDPQLGKVDPSLKSGRAIAFLQQQSQHGTSNYLDNLRRSIRYEGQIINNLLFPIYGKPGRIARIVTPEGDAQTVRIGPPPMPSASGAPTQMPGMAPMGQSAPPKPYQLTKDAGFNVIVKVSQSYDSRRSQEAAMMGDLLSANPQLMTVFGDIFFRNLDTPGHMDISERMRVMLAPPIQAMIASKQQGGTPPDPQVMQLKSQLQQAESLLQQASQEINSKQIETQAKLQIAQMEADKDVRLQAMRDASAIAVAKIAALSRGVISDNERQVEELALGQEMARTAVQHEQALHADSVQRGHQAASDAVQHAHDAMQAAHDRTHELATMQLEHQQTLEQQQQAADLAPEPEADTENEPA